MSDTKKLLSDIVVYTKYAKHNPILQRRETWEEIVDRYINMLVKKYPKLKNEIRQNSEYIYDKKVLPSMRALQFAGPAIEKNEARIYNCAFMPMDDYRAFSELMFLLLGGTGVGYSVQYNDIDKLPEIQKPTKQAKYLIGDSIEGWSDAIKQLMKAYFGKTKVKPRFDYSDIRDKGDLLITAGGKAPGPEPLRICLTKIEALLVEKENGSKLTDFEVHRINCLIADAVLAGGIRRAAMICLFSFDSKIMATCKHGNWWEKYPELGRANNSAAILRNRVKKAEFKEFWKLIEDSKSGEPGISWTNNPAYGFNPCHEIALRPYQFCNLTEINADTIIDQEDFNNRSRVAAFFGTLQAGFTDFHYLRPIWQKTTEKDALVGVGITGIAANTLEELDKTEAAKVAVAINADVATDIGINFAARVTTIKPSGSTSCVLGCASGIHAWWSNKFVRNMQCKVGDDLYNFFANNHPELITIMEYDPESAVIGIPLEASEGGTTRSDETTFDFLERVKKMNLEWVAPGHISGPNNNNVSATISVKDDEWNDVAEWMWENRDTYSGLSVIPFDGGTYKNAPFEIVSDEIWERKFDYIQNNQIDLTQIEELIDNTAQSDELACSGGSCEITF